jgi:hypothetical protein
MEHGGGPAWLLAIEHSGLGQAMRQSVWLYPAVEVTHIFGFVLLVGPIVAYDLRLLGVGPRLPADLLGRLLVRTSVVGFALVLPSGLLLFATEASSIAANPVFPVKLGLIALGLANAALFRVAAGRELAAWSLSVPPPSARVAGGVSLLAWAGAIVCGRLLAYF